MRYSDPITDKGEKLMKKIVLASITVILLLCVPALSRAEIFKAVFIDGDTLFNGTYTPDGRSFDSYYTAEEKLKAKLNAERSCKVLLMDEKGVFYYPCQKEGKVLSINQSWERFTRNLTEEQQKQKAAGKRFRTWIAYVPLIGQVVTVEGDVYPGVAGIKAINIKGIEVEQEVER